MASKKDISDKNEGWAELKLKPRELIVPLMQKMDLDDDIPTLPDLDDLGDELEKQLEATSPPAAREKWMRPDSGTYAELDNDEVQLGDISLNALSAHIRSVSTSAAPEPDVVWTVPSLLQELGNNSTKM